MAKMDYGDGNHGVTRDLIRKASEDVGAVMARLYEIAPEPFLPVGVSAAGSALMFVSADLAKLAGILSPKPDHECVLLAALLAARCGLDGLESIHEAYADLETLKAAGRIPVAAKAEVADG